MSKLIRDKIPELIKSNGEAPIFHTADDEEYAFELDRKIMEESIEFAKATDETQQKEELADVFEVIFAILGFHNFEFDEIEELRQKRKIEKYKQQVEDTNPEAYLKLRLIEKSTELAQTEGLWAKRESLADTIDALFDILRFKNFSLDEIEEIMDTKREEKWGFLCRVILDWVE